MLAVPAGRDIPATGAGERGRGPEAPSRGSCRTGTARVAASPRTPSRPPGSAGPGGEDGLEAAPPRAGAGTAGVSRGREEQPRSGAGWLSGRAAAQGEGPDTGGHLQGSPRQWGGAWRQQEQPRCVFAPVAGLQHLATGLAAPVQTLSLSKLTQGCSKGNLKSSIYTPSTGTNEGKNASRGFRSLPRKGRPTFAFSCVPRSILSWVGTH